jgi:BlaI family penicillinase repressor
MAKEDSEITRAEWQIIKVIWTLHPCTAPDVHEALESSTQWHYSTVKTLMDRMVEKGFLKCEKLRNLNIYNAVITETKAQKKEVMKTLKRAFDGAMTPMMQFLLNNQNLSLEELQEIEKMVKQKRQKMS